MPHPTANRVSARRAHKQKHNHDQQFDTWLQPTAPRPFPMEVTVAMRPGFQCRRRQHHSIDVHFSMRRRILGSEVHSQSRKPLRYARSPAQSPTQRPTNTRSVAQKATLGSAVFLGQLMGATIWGPVRLRCTARSHTVLTTQDLLIWIPHPILPTQLADIYGRRPAFLVSCAIVGIAGILSSMMTSLTALLVCRTLCGVGIGGVEVPMGLLSEFLPELGRGR